MSAIDLGGGLAATFPGAVGSPATGTVVGEAPQTSTRPARQFLMLVGHLPLMDVHHS